MVSLRMNFNPLVVCLSRLSSETNMYVVLVAALQRLGVSLRDSS